MRHEFGGVQIPLLVEHSEGCSSLEKLKGLKGGLWEAYEDGVPLKSSLLSFEDPADDRALFLFAVPPFSD